MKAVKEGDTLLPMAVIFWDDFISHTFKDPVMRQSGSDGSCQPSSQVIGNGKKHWATRVSGWVRNRK